MNGTDINSLALDFAQAAGEFASTARSVAEEKLAEEKQAKPLVEKLAKQLLHLSLIREDEQGEAIKQASSHFGALSLLDNLLDYYGRQKQAGTQKQAAALGRSVPAESSSPGEQRKSPSYIGSKRGLGEKRASDLALLRGLGITVD